MPREEKPIRWKTLLFLLAVALFFGSLYRFVDLGKKPVHTDEAILAIKTQEYWKTGTFEYDPRDYHGPFLHHLAKWVGSLRGWQPDALTEEQLRWVVAVCGLLLVLTPLFFLDVIGRTGAGVASLFLAVSPMMSYYSRYYIMETPFVLQVALFTACLWQWAKRKNKLWLLPAGVLLGWMHATKETFVLNIAALVAACAVVKLTGLRFEINQRGYGFRSFTRRPKPWWSWVIFGAVAVSASVWMFSNGFHDWDHVVDSVRTYESYLGRSQGAGGHEKPWHYYLSLFFGQQLRLFWSEALIGGLAVIGMLNGFLDARRADHKRAFLVALSTYTLVLLGIYSFIPYKTPWSVLSVGYAFALLAGLGARTIFRVFTDAPLVKAILALALSGGIYHLCRQSSLATDYSFENETRYAASEAHNPYAYSHTVPNLVKLSDRIHELAKKHPAGKAIPLQVIDPEWGWPLPWYLRDLTHVGYQADIPEKIQADVVIVDSGREAQVLKKLGTGWEQSHWGLRSDIMLALLVHKEGAKKEPEPPDTTPVVPFVTPPLPSIPGQIPAPLTGVPGVQPLPVPAVSVPPVSTPTPTGAAPPLSALPPVTVPSPPSSEPMPPKAQLVEEDAPAGEPTPTPTTGSGPAPTPSPIPPPSASASAPAPPPAPAPVPVPPPKTPPRASEPPPASPAPATEPAPAPPQPSRGLRIPVTPASPRP